ncbi:solute:sodium symporter family transporter [Marinihelvus fidelis]|uniref:Solute:sodium symporter family transporter n=1 Tax=Marinihelvus fidelis TaxID=2613842 RepID=A0A5N0TB16_9GAMM|nr:solute:sodium symporter family transporter [Marinihelvus fidelis]KAA9131624.1 solute:sodium symporter family transporter [Marinihelvus fidelis]
MNWVGFVGFTALVAVIAWLGTRRHQVGATAEGYFLAGRSLGPLFIAGSLMLTNLSTEHLIGLNGDAFQHTIAVTAWETTAALAMVLTALVFLPLYLRNGLTTIPEFLDRRFDSTTRVIMSALFLLSYAVAILPVVLLFGASGMESLFDVSGTLGISEGQARWLLVWGIGGLGSLYAIFGGLRAIAISDTINGVGFLLASLMIPVLALMAVGDGDMLAGLETVYTEEKPKFDITGNEPGSFLPFGVLFTGMIVNQVFFWCVNQSILQRALGARSLAAGQQGVLLAALFKLLGPLVVVLPGVIAWHLFKGELQREDYLQAYPMLVAEVLPPALAGLFAAVMVGAVLSTFNSVLNSAATLFSHGIWRPLFQRDASDRQMVASGRWCSIVLAIAAMVTAPRIDTSGSLYNYLQQINATFFGPMLAVILAALFTRRASALAAKTALVVGPVVFYMVNFAWREPIQAAVQSAFGLQEEIHFLHWLAVVFVFTVALITAISAWRPDTRSHAPAAPAPVDMTPWRMARPISALVVLATLATYILLAQ